MSGSGIASAQGTVVFSLPPSATPDPCAPPQPPAAAFPVAPRSTLSPNASPFVPKNYPLPIVAAATPQAPFAAVADSDMSYAPALPPNVQTIYVTGLPGYYAPYVPTPTVPFYTMQYQCVYQPPPPPPPPALCCPMEEGGGGSLPLVADEAPPALLAGGGGQHHHMQPSASGTALLPHPPQHQQQPTLIIQNSGRRNKKKSRSGRRRDHTSHRDCAAVVDTEACVAPEYGRNNNSAAARNSSNSGTNSVTMAASRGSYGPGVSSPDFSSSSEFPSLPVQELFPQRQSPSGSISYSSALQQQRAAGPPPRPPLLMSSPSVGGAEPSSSLGGGPHNNTRGPQRRGVNAGNNVSGADARPHKRGGGGGGARKHRRGGGGGGPGASGEGRRSTEDAAADASRSQQQQQPHYHQQQQQERRGGARRGKAHSAAATAAMDGEAEKHQFEAPEKDVKGELRLPRPPTAEVENASRANSAGGRSSNQGGGGVRLNASRGRRETRHSSLLRGVLKSGAERQGLRSGGRKGSDAAERNPVATPQEQQQQQQRTGGENRSAGGTQQGDDKPASRKNSRSFVGENESSEEYPPLGSSGGVEDKLRERTPDGRTAKSDVKDTVKVQQQGDNIPKQQQPPRDKGATKQAVPAPPASVAVKPLVSTNSGGPKHKTAISMAIADIMVPKQRQPKKLKEKENLLERSSKKPEVGGWDP